MHAPYTTDYLNRGVIYDRKVFVILAPVITRKYLTRDKHSSLSCPADIDEEESFVTLAARCQYNKTSFDKYYCTCGVFPCDYD